MGYLSDFSMSKSTRKVQKRRSKGLREVRRVSEMNKVINKSVIC